MARPRSGLDFRPHTPPEILGTVALHARPGDTYLFLCDPAGAAAWLDAAERAIDSDDGGFTYKRVRLEHGGLRPIATCRPWIFNRDGEAACIPPLGANQPFLRLTVPATQRLVAVLRRVCEAPVVTVKWTLTKLPKGGSITLYFRQRSDADMEAESPVLEPAGGVLERAEDMTPPETR